MSLLVSKLFDAHTHMQKPHSCYIVDLNKNFNPNDYYFALGLHPWDIEEASLEQVFKEIIKYKEHPNFAGIGEIGLDRAKMKNWDDQVRVFTKQIHWAKKNDINRIILHSVKAYSDILEILRKLSFEGSLMLHDFRGNTQVFDQFNSKYKTYYSLGKHFTNRKDGKQLLSTLPLNQLLIESDIDNEQTLTQNYNYIAEILNIEVSELVSIVHKNFKGFLAPSFGE